MLNFDVRIYGSRSIYACILMGFMGIDYNFRRKFHSQSLRLILTIRVNFCFEVTIQALYRTL